MSLVPARWLTSLFCVQSSIVSVCCGNPTFGLNFECVRQPRRILPTDVEILESLGYIGLTSFLTGFTKPNLPLLQRFLVEGRVLPTDILIDKGPVFLVSTFHNKSRFVVPSEPFWIGTLFCLDGLHYFYDLNTMIHLWSTHLTKRVLLASLMW